MTSLATRHDCLLLDLDGTLFRGARAIDGAAEALSQASTRKLFLTNNASRSAPEVAQHLCAMGFDANPHDVITSGRCAAALLGSELPPGSPVLVVGSDALIAEVYDAGLPPVRRWADDPIAVLQGFSPHLGWCDLAETALAIGAGTPWTATNPDLTLPSERGLLPGNGSLVSALCAASGARPRVVGKPHGFLFQEALARGNFQRPLVIGDGLDTDIAGANYAGLPSLLVLSGVTTAVDAIRARPAHRPRYVAADLRGIHHPNHADLSYHRPPPADHPIGG
ncbi:HAD-IIA family hydrolase [Mycobacterium sherrisii]|uniref:HAD family hydrolase n=1 Tax=Mycobacterium sherrisii TaxID=243061 RepID=A0A1E3SWP8_9MYCO|nr:HAD-IIA family hydrolase [Mycobacterium sherrisii]MCV7031955.1 HAD-IIA family hydrolase [Mycobacterium sherrisii]ODR06566.1 hypothetical protein BHQ21_10785 [Mycobacterium sherrisii]ORW85742.1 hypothetical protein AWC25_22705 [Mycobacterium sherrisii]